MTYPKSNPVNKHDLISAAEVSLSRMSPSLSPQELLQEASNSITSNQSKSYPKKISTIYTYNDAPAEPKPMTARLPIQGFCSLASIGLGTSSFLQPTLEGMTTCMVAVKRADDEYKKKLHLQPKDITNSNNFAILCRQLRDNEKCAFFVCPKTKRGGFIVAMDDTMDGCDYAAYCLVAPIDDLERILNQNGSNDVPMNADTADATTWNSNDEVAGESNDAGLWKPPTNENDGQETSVFESNNLWKPSTPPEQNDLSNSLWKPSTHPEQNDLSNNLWKPSTPPEQTDFYAQSTDMDATTLTTNEFEEPSSNTDNGNETFHANSGAAAADAFYSNLTRSLGTRADSMLYHMRNFNGWIKATQISELDPLTVDSSNSQSKKRKRTKHPLRVLDLACGKGGDLGKWVLHKRGIGNYVGIDVARGSLGDAAVRARKMRQLNKCVFTCADLGSDVPGRVKSNEHKKMQKLLSWSLKEDDGYGDPNFRLVRGGGIAETDKFDVVSIQFAIHYMMSSIKRARRFFHTVSQLLEIGGNLIATTIDARVVMEHMMNTGYNFDFDESNDENGDSGTNSSSNEHLIVSVGNNVCQLKFHRDTVKRIFQRDGDKNGLDPNHFGLEYTFTLIEGQDHAAGVGQAVNLPEWLTPLPVLVELASEAGLKLDYAQNFHEFFSHRKDPMANHAVHGALYNMSVLNRSGTISEQEWEISRMYMAVKFTKERESTLVMDDEVDTKDEEESDEEMGDEPLSQESPKKIQIDMNDPRAKSMFVMAMAKAKKGCGEQWQNMSGDERNLKTNEELAKLMAK